MPRSLTVSFEVGGGENVPGIPGACTTRNFYVSGKRSMWKRTQYFSGRDLLMTISMFSRYTSSRKYTWFLTWVGIWHIIFDFNARFLVYFRCIGILHQHFMSHARKIWPRIQTLVASEMNGRVGSNVRICKLWRGCTCEGIEVCVQK